MLTEIKAAETVVPRTVEGLARAASELLLTLPADATVIVTPFLTERLTVRGEWVVQECEGAGCEKTATRLDASGWAFCADHTDDDLPQSEEDA